MIESPLIDEIVSEAVSEAEARTSHEAILVFLRTRFNTVPAELEDRIRSVVDKEVLTQMTRDAAACDDLETFAQSLA